MKIILVDAVNTLVIKGEGLFTEMHTLLEEYPNRKLILTNADDEQMERFGLNSIPYEVFTQKHNPDKTSPVYFKVLLKKYDLQAKDVLYFEHNLEAVKSAESLGIKSYHYNATTKDLSALQLFLNANL